MKTNFRVKLSQDTRNFKESISKIENSIIKNIANDMLNNQGGNSWLKAHGDVSWGKGKAVSIE
jgi:hypothetical protein